jgi:HSP20 family protein
METAMADIPVEVKKTAPTQTNVPDVWNSFRGEMDRLFDRFGFPSLRRVFDMEPSWRPASSFSFSTPAIDMSEDDKAYKISAELPGIDAKDIDVSLSGDTLVLKGEKRQEKEQKTRIITFPSAPTARSNALSSSRRASIATGSPPTFRTGF